MRKIRYRQISKTVVLFLIITILLSSLFCAGCSGKSKSASGDSGSKTDDNKPDSQSFSLGKLGFVTRFVKVEDLRGSYDGSVIYLMENENKDVYVLMGFCDDEGGSHLVGDTFEIKKVTDGFKAKKLVYSSALDSYGDDRYFYIWDENDKIHKCTIHIGQYSDGTIIDKNTLQSEEIDIPENIVDFQVTRSSGNYVLTEDGNVYAWYNTVNGSLGSDYSTYENFKEVIFSGDDLKENTVGFSDGLRHDKPTKLPLSNIKQMFSLKDEHDRVYLSNSGEVYRRFTDSDNKVEFVLLENLNDIQYFYPTDSSAYAVGVNSNHEAELYYLGKFYSQKDTRIIKTALSGASFEKAVNIYDSCFFKQEKDGLRDIWCQGEYCIFSVYTSNHGTEYYTVKDDKVSLYVPSYDETVEFDTTIDYLSMNDNYTDIWLDKSGTLYWYNNANKNEKYILAENVRGYRILDHHSDFIPYAYAETQFLNSGNTTVFFLNDGSVKAYSTDRVKKGEGEIVELDANYYGNGTYGMFVPGENGKYKVCDKMKKDGSYKVAAELELPE